MSIKAFKSTLTVGGMTFISRIFGYVRDAIIFIVFGANAGTDAYFVAFRLPNFLRRIFAEGAFSQAFVPVLSSHLHDGEPQFRRLIDHMAGLLSIVLILLTIVGIGVLIIGIQKTQMMLLVVVVLGMGWPSESSSRDQQKPRGKLELHDMLRLG